MQVFDDRFQAESGWNWFLMTASKQSQDGNLPLPNMQQKPPDDGQRRCPKHVEFYNRINLNN
jgi:hypothetical protein